MFEHQQKVFRYFVMLPAQENNFSYLKKEGKKRCLNMPNMHLNKLKPNNVQLYN